MIKKIIMFIYVIVNSFALFSNSFDNLNFTKIEDYKYTFFYNVEFSQNVLEKINLADENVIKYLEETDNSENYSNHILTEKEKNVVLKYFELMPNLFQEIFTNKVYSIYFLDGLNYGGRTEFVYDEDFNMCCIIYFNASTLRKSLSEWIEYRDNSIFSDITENNKFSIEFSNNYYGFLHTLIHETCHVYDYMNDISIFPISEEKNVFTINWDDFNLPIKKYRNKKIMQFEFYGLGNTIRMTKGKNLLYYLKSSSFSSLYGAKNRADDFAETVTCYILYNKFHLNYKVNYIENGLVKETYLWSENENIKNLYLMCSEIAGI